jgi:hypothetical protein
MRKLLMLAVLVLVAGQTYASTPMDGALVAVNDPDRSTVSQLLSGHVTVVRDMERYLLVVADPGDLAAMDAMGVAWEMLDSSMAGKAYYTVTGHPSRLAAQVPQARVLRSDEFDSVVEATPKEAEQIAGNGFEIARVFIRPIRLSPTVRPTLLKGAREYDPAIQTMVDSVSGAEIDAGVQRLQDFVTRYAAHDSCQAAANWLKAEFESYGIDSVYFHHFHSTYEDNVVAVIPGQGDPSKIVVVGGHYDSITSTTYENCPGADDNATGTICAVECARVLSDHQFNYTIVFIAFGGEELGLYGSEGYASDAAANGDDIIGAIAVDMIGYVAGGDVMDLDIIDNASSAWLRNLAFDAANLYVPDLPLVDGTLPGGASSDHASFWAHGYDAILFFEDTGDYSPYIHTTSDIVGLSYNTPVFAERSVKVAVATIASLAEPFTVAIIHTPLEHTEDTQNPYRVVADIVAAGTLESDSLYVAYSTGSGDGFVPMTPTQNPDEYEAYIPAQPGGTFVEYYIMAEDTEGHRKYHPSTAPAGRHAFFVGTITTFFQDDFDDDKGWTIGVPGDDATTGVWERCDPQGTEAQPEDDHTPSPGVLAYITQCAAGSGQGDYDIDGGKTTLTSPAFDLTGWPNVWVRYYAWYVNDTGNAPGEDSWVVQISDDGWTTWEYLENTTESTHAWELREFEVAHYVDLTDQVQLRFIASDEGDGSIVEAGVDDFELVTFQEPSTDVAGAEATAPARMTLAQNIPNPFNPLTSISFSVPAPGRNVTLKVFDVSGRRVRTLLENAQVSGTRVVEWDGTDSRGHSVATGIYFYRLETEKESLTRKMILIK